MFEIWQFSTLCMSLWTYDFFSYCFEKFSWEVDLFLYIFLKRLLLQKTILTICFLVSKAWRDAAFSRDTRKFIYIGQRSSRIPQRMLTLTFTEFLKIFNFVAPKLKYIQIYYNNEFYDKEFADAYVEFGSFKFMMGVNKFRDDKILKNALLKLSKSCVKLKIDSFDDATALEWEQFFQSNPCLNHIVYRAGVYMTKKSEHKTFINCYLPILPSKLTKIGLIFVHPLLDAEQKQISQVRYCKTE